VLPERRDTAIRPVVIESDMSQVVLDPSLLKRSLAALFPEGLDDFEAPLPKHAKEEDSKPFACDHDQCGYRTAYKSDLLYALVAQNRECVASFHV
jgi:hypothetical protein